MGKSDRFFHASASGNAFFIVSLSQKKCVDCASYASNSMVGTSRFVHDRNVDRHDLDFYRCGGCISLYSKDRLFCCLVDQYFCWGLQYTQFFFSTVLNFGYGSTGCIDHAGVFR